MISQKQINQVARELLQAEAESEPIDPITDKIDLSVEEAYKIQLKVIEKKKANGRKIIGKKIGLTSKRMQEAFGIDQPDYGHITDKMNLDVNQPIVLSELIQPKLEVEIGFILNEDLEGPGVTSSKVLQCTHGVVPTFEVIDSRIKEWNIQVQDSIADNASIARVIQGSPLTKPYNLDLRTVGIVVRKNGKLLETAAGAEVLGNPAQSVAWLANKLSEYDIPLKKGELIISGSVISPIEIENGDTIQADFGDGLGTITTYIANT